MTELLPVTGRSPRPAAVRLPGVRHPALHTDLHRAVVAQINPEQSFTSGPATFSSGASGPTRHTQSPGTAVLAQWSSPRT